MSERTECNRPFEEHLLSGYLDGALTQGDEQRVRLHLEDCGSCRTEYEDMKRYREAAMSTNFEPMEDDQWNEAPRGTLSHLTRNVGWGLIGVWLLAALAVTLWIPNGHPPEAVARALAAAAIGGTALLLVSVVADRLRTRRKDVYREVKR